MHSPSILSDKLTLLSVVSLFESGELNFTPDPRRHGRLWFYIKDNDRNTLNRYIVDSEIAKLRRVFMQSDKPIASEDSQKLFDKERENIRLAIDRFDM